jgi:DNA-binding IclR family transcriptional regulator
MRKTTYTLQSVDNALRLMGLLAESVDSLRLSEISARLGVSGPTSHRLLTTLSARGFVQQDAEGRYRAGPVLARLTARRGNSALDPRDLVRIARPHLESLGVSVGETVHLMVLDGRAVRFLHSVEAAQALCVGSRTGVSLPAEKSSGGKALLAALPPDDLRARYSDDVEAATKLLQVLRAVRRNGYAINNGETERGITAVGGCVKDLSGLPLAAISISVPSIRFRQSRCASLVRQLDETGRRIAADLPL